MHNRLRMTIPELKSKLQAIHDDALASGLSVRFWDLRRTCLVLSLPDGEKAQVDGGSGSQPGGVDHGPEGRQQEGQDQGADVGAGAGGGE